MMLSLDHTVWFHEQFCTDEWMLYQCEAPRMSKFWNMNLGFETRISASQKTWLTYTFFQPQRRGV